MRGGRFALPLALVALAAGASHSFAQTGSQAVLLTWTAPSDNGGRDASIYDVRYARFPITEDNWQMATRAAVFRPHRPGMVEHYVIHGLFRGTNFYFAVKTMDYQGNWSPISNIAVGHRVIGGELNEGDVSLTSVRPNPARAVTHIGVTLERQAPVQIDVFDTSGRRVRVLQSGVLPAGPTEISWDLTNDQGRSVRAGLYLIRARTEESTTMRRVVVTR